MLRLTRMCCNFGSMFCKKSLNMGPCFIKKIPMGLIFKIFANPRKFRKFGVFLQQNRKKWVPFSRKKSLNIGTYFFLKNYPWTWVWVWAAGGTSPTNPTPLVQISFKLHFNLGLSMNNNNRNFKKKQQQTQQKHIN